MSGSYRFYSDIDDYAEVLRASLEQHSPPSEYWHYSLEQQQARRKLIFILEGLSKVCKDVEWVDEGDSSTPADVESIERFVQDMVAEFSEKVN